VYGIHNNNDHIDEGRQGVGERREGWKNGERWEKGERGWEKLGRQEIKEKRGRREREEEWEKTTPCPPPHRFRDSFCLFGITNAHHTPVI
jgi:hypothetical protein